MNELINRLKIRTNKADEALLAEMLLDAIEQVKDFTRQNESYIMFNLQGVVLQLATIKLNKVGNEGITTASMSGVSESYLDDMPTEIKKQLYKHRRMAK